MRSRFGARDTAVTVGGGVFGAKLLVSRLWNSTAKSVSTMPSTHRRLLQAFLLVAALNAACGQGQDRVPLVDRQEARVQNGDLLTVNCEASFAREDEIRWFKLDSIADFAGPISCQSPSGGSGEMAMSGDGMTPVGSGNGMVTTVVPTTTEAGTGLTPMNSDTDIVNATFITVGSQLVFNPVMFEENGYYVCVVTQSTSECNSDAVTVSVSPNGSVAVDPVNPITARGDSVTFTCSAQGGPGNEFQWQRNGGDLENETLANLTVANISASEGGSYTCVVSNAAGDDSEAATLYIQPYIVTQPEDVLTTNGSEVNFTCEAESFPAPQYQWIDVETMEIVSMAQTLTFSPAVFGDEGRYVCMATAVDMDMVFGRVSSDVVTLAVSPEGSVEVRPRNPLLILGANISFTCDSQGGPNNTIQWFRGEDILEFETSPTLFLDNIIAASDGGEYTCVVSNVAGSENASSVLLVEPSITVDPIDVFADVGDFVMLLCMAEAFPEAVYSWMRIGSEIREDIDGQTNTTLIFDPVIFGDEGAYVCTASSSNVSVNSRVATLTVSPLSSVRVEPVTEIAEFGDSVTFTCSAEGGPGNEFQWQRNGGDLENETSANLTVANISASEGGNYTCVVSNAAGNDSETATLYVEPFIVIQPEDVLTTNGSEVNFTCVAESFPAPQYQWIQMDGTVVANTSTLTLSPALFGDEGFYTCRVENQFTTEVDEAMALLTISPEDSVAVSPTVVNALVEDNVTFVCTAQGGPDNLFTWVREVDGRAVGSDPVLEVDVQSAFDGSAYTCTVVNAAGLDSATATLNVEPQFIQEPLSTNVTSTENFTLICEASGFPIPNITWQHNGSLVTSDDRTTLEFENGDRSTVGTLSIFGAMTNDSGEYECRVSSLSLFSDILSAPALVLVQDTPEQPQNVMAVNVTSRNLTLTWIEPHDNNAPILGYFIEFQQPPFRSMGAAVTLNTSTESVFIEDLHPGVTYNFTVTAFNGIGEGRSSDVTPIATLEEAPSGFPQNVAAFTNSSTEILIVWDPVREAERLGEIVSYGVFVLSLELRNSTLISTDATTELLVGSLEEFTEYTFSVQASTSIGDGPFGPSVTSTTFEDVPANFPTNVTALAVSSTSIRVSWEEVPAIDQNGIITAYEVRYQPLMTFNGALMTAIASVNASVFELELNGLEEFVEYNISVRAYTSVGAGPYSPEVTERTNEDVPTDFPTNVTAMAASSNSIRVSWEEVPAIDQNGITTEYEVRYQPLVTFNGALMTATVNTSVFELELNGLEEFVEYNISVRAYTSVGAGPYSPEVTERTNEDVPANFPTNVTAMAASSTSIRVSWEEVPAIDQNGIITTYEVRYQPLMTFNGALMTATVNTSVFELELNGLEEFVVYNISVRAYTSVGAGPYSPEVTERTNEDVPANFPTNVTAMAVSSTSIRVSWEEVPAIDQNGIITTYEVRYQPLMTFDAVLMTATVNATGFEAVLNGLEEFVEYNISVRAYTSVGAGPYSPEVTERTNEDVPANFSTNVTAMAVSSTSIRVSWEEVPAIDQNGIITTYEVRYQPLMTFNGALMTATVNASVFEAVLNGLEEFVEYNISVRAYTSVGAGPYSAEVTERTNEDVPANFPTNVTAMAVSSTSIRVSWEEVPAIDQNGIITTYEVRYQPLMTFDAVLMTATVNATGFEAVLNGLEEFVEYNISVRAYTSVGAGPYSPEVTERTNEDVPANFPTNVTAMAVSSTSIRVSWEEVPAIDQNGIITTYEVRYQPLMTFNRTLMTMSVLIEDPTTMSIALENLMEYVQYNISVRAGTRVGEGPFSPEITERTNEDVPDAAPRNIEVANISANDLSVSWERPDEIGVNGILRNYIIEYYITNQPDNSTATFNVSGSTLSTQLTELNNFTEYTVSVSAYTIGQGPAATGADATSENVPGLPPRNVRAENDSSTSILVEWDAPEALFVFGILRGYIIRFAVVNSTSGLEESISTDVIFPPNNSYIIEDLLEFTNYSIEVAAVTIGEGPYSDPVIVITDQDEPGQVARPPPVQNSDLTAFSAVVRWNAPIDPNGEITRYNVIFVALSKPDRSLPGSRRKRQNSALDLQVECIIGGSGNINRTIVLNGNPPQTFATLTELTPDTVYEFIVQAETAVGPGTFSPSRTFNTAENVPSEPLNLSVAYISSTTLLVTWDPPQCDYGVRTSYIITHDPQPSALPPMGVQGSPVSPDTLGPSDTSLEIGSLTPNTNYSVTICAATVVGCGNVTSAVNQTDEAAPDAVTGLQISSRMNGNTDIRVIVDFSWSRPSERNGLYDYRLVFSADQVSPFPSERRESIPEMTVTLDGTSESYAIQEGLPFADYSVRITAFNIKRNLDGPTVPVIDKTIAIAPIAVLNLNVVPTSEESLQVSWELPLFPNGELAGFVVFYRVSSVLQSLPISSSGYNSTALSSNTIILLDNLEPHTNYSVHVQAMVSFNGSLLPGAIGEELLQRTDITNSSAVVDLTAVATSPTSILVTWEPPLTLNGPLQEYFVYYMQSDEVQTVPISSDNYNRSTTLDTCIKLEDLTPFTNYSIHAQASVSENGQAAFLGVIEVEILQRTNSTIPPPSQRPTPLTPTAIPLVPDTQTISIQIPQPDQIQTGIVFAVFIVVVEVLQSEVQDQSAYDSAGPYTLEALFYITAGWGKQDIQNGRVPSAFLIGSGLTTVVDNIRYLNAPLKSGTAYSIFVRYDIEADNDQPLITYSDFKHQQTATPFPVAGVVIAIIIVLVVIAILVTVILIVCLRYRKRYTGALAIRTVDIRLDKKELQTFSAPPLTHFVNPLADSYRAGTREPVNVRDFADHVRNLHANDDFYFSEEYAALEPNHDPTLDACRRPENIPKNRYANITSYDHSRVRLQETSGILGSDYINANFIDGYNLPNGFIGTQGPVPASIPDFWRMIWEQSSATIVMLTNLEEKGRLKCHQYWPHDTHTPIMHGALTVDMVEVLELAEYTVRTFSLKKASSKEERTIRQFHYTVWPDHGVPAYPSPLLAFVRKVTTSNPENAGPIIVHCSAGVGRTGTFITLHAQMKRLKAEDNYDIFGFVEAMRYRRCFMVQTEPQYVFIHDALLEALECGVTEVAARNLKEQYRGLGIVNPVTAKSRLQTEFANLDATVHAKPMISYAAMPTNKTKNRYANTDMIPYDKTRCRLSTIPGMSGSDYINASHIDGYTKRMAFLATQSPLPDTVDDFWRMIWEQKAATIVMLTKEKEGGRVKCQRYWPQSGADNFGFLQLVLHSVNEYPDYILREFNMVDTRDGSSLPVKQYQYTGWPVGGVPDNGSGLIDLIGQVEKWQISSGEKPIVVHCASGCGRTGTFIAVSLLLERLKTEAVVDVFHTVRALRLQRPGMVHKVEQYEFCYKTVLEFLDSFELYSNFK